MAADVYRCADCHREVLVRSPGPMTKAERRRRIDEEMRPLARGPQGQADLSTRLRDSIWEHISGTRGFVPRERPPEACPACGHRSLRLARILP